MKPSSYLILASQHDADLQKPWQVYRCYYSSQQQDLLFTGSRDEAKAYLAAHWED